MCLSLIDESNRTRLTVVIESLDPPAIENAKSSETQVGHMGVLQCDVAAVPKPEFEWYRDDKR